jgi:hypothetical protein
VPAFVAADATVRQATNMKEAIALANELLPAIQGRYELEYRELALQKDELGRVRLVRSDRKFVVDLTAAPFPQQVEALPVRAPNEDQRERYGLTPPRSVDAFQVDLEQARRRDIELTAKTLIHEWAHTALNRQLGREPDAADAYTRATTPVAMFESLRFKSPATGEFVQVTPSGPGVTGHEMVAQFTEHLFEVALAKRKKAHR